VRNSNVTATGYDKFPAALNHTWNIDWTNGINTDASQIGYGTTSNGLRIDGNCRYNTNGEDETLLFSLPRGRTKRVAGYGSLSSGFTGNSTVYYIQHLQQSGSGAQLDQVFSVPSKSPFFGKGPKVWPYDQSPLDVGEVLTSNLTDIKNNFILVNKTTGNVVTSEITTMKVTTDGENDATFVTATLKAIAGTDDYELLAPMKAEEVHSAYKELVVANTTASSDGASNLDQGQLFIAAADLADTQNLTVPDGFKLRKVIHHFDPFDPSTIAASFALTPTAEDITDSYIFDTGQRDTFYDNAHIKLKSESPVTPSGNLFVMFDHFKRVSAPKPVGGGARTEAMGDSPGFFSVDSYQYTTDLIFSQVSSTPFGIGDYIVSNTGASGYITEFSNTTGFSARASIEASNGSFLVGETVVTKAITGNKIAKIDSIVASDLTYEQIPVYTTSSGDQIKLSNSIDCRPYANSSGRYSETLSDSTLGLIPTAGDVALGKTTGVSQITSSHVVKTYAPRIDKLVVDRNGDYYMVKGVPDLDNPLPPMTSRFRGEDELVLFNIQVPAYTYDLNDVVQNRNTTTRHTMKDISRLKKRIENLE
jgi:hypothetical protein